MAAPNLANITSIYGNVFCGSLGTATTTDMIVCPANKVLKVNSIVISNIDGTNSVDATVYFYDSSLPARLELAYTIPVPADSTLVVISKDTAIYLEEGDQIEAGASASGDAQIVISYEEIDDA